MKKPYRRNVGIVVFNKMRLVLVGERVDYPGSYQFPQGGIDEGETPEEAAKRELFEEIGLEIKNPFAGKITDWFFYDFPPEIPEGLKKFRGQMQKWFFYFWNGSPEKLKLDNHEREFSHLRWMTMERIRKEVVYFKRPVYNKIIDEGEKIINDFIS